MRIRLETISKEFVTNAEIMLTPNPKFPDDIVIWGVRIFAITNRRFKDRVVFEERIPMCLLDYHIEPPDDGDLDPSKPQQFNIIVNGKKLATTLNFVNYEAAVALSGRGWLEFYTITYSKGPLAKHEGTITQGDKIEVTEGMIINVADTSNA